jgi:hypothetical protein
LPGPLDLSALRRLAAGTASRPGAGIPVTLGVGGDAAAPVVLDLAERSPGLYVTGGSGDDRRGALLAIALDVLERGFELIVLAPETDVLRDCLRGLPGVVAALKMAVPDAVRVAWAAVSGDRPVVVFIDDGDKVQRSEAAPILRALLRGSHGMDGPPRAAVTSVPLDAVSPAPREGFLADHGAGAGLIVDPRAPRAALFSAPAMALPQFDKAERDGLGVLVLDGRMSPLRMPRVEAEAARLGAQSRPWTRRQLFDVARWLAGPDGRQSTDRLRSIIRELRAEGFEEFTAEQAEAAAALAQRPPAEDGAWTVRGLLQAAVAGGR